MNFNKQHNTLHPGEKLLNLFLPEGEKEHY
jgi:hypothetical protein